MTTVFHHSNHFAFEADNARRFYTIEVITFDGESEIIEVEATDATEACEIAASQVADADYAMVQGVA